MNVHSSRITQPIAEGLFTQGEPPRLIGGRNRDSGRVVFPCPEDGCHDPVALGRMGTLWSFTIQRFRPKSPPYAGPEAFTPFAVAYVELPDEVIVEARLTDVAFEEIRIGMALELHPVPLDPARPGERMIPAFAPLERSA